MSEGYKKGDKCHICGRIVEVNVCPVCDGSGKSKGNWQSFTDICPACQGTKERIVCPIGGYMPLSFEFEGINCSHVDFIDGIGWIKKEVTHVER